MKKQAFIAMTLMLMTIPVIAADFEPQWSEFYRPNDQTGFSAFRNGGLFGLIGNKAYKQKDQIYWDKRQQQFDQEIGGCNQIADTGQKMSCYNQIRTIEGQRTAEYWGEIDSAHMRREMRISRILQANHRTNVNCYSSGSMTSCSGY